MDWLNAIWDWSTKEDIAAFSTVVASIIALIALLWGFYTYWKSKADSPSGQPDVSGHNRQRMLEKVHHFWIDGVLDQSLYHVARMELGLVEQPEAVEHPWKLVTQQPERSPRLLPDGLPVQTVFDQFDKTLLLLGAPGTGKTTLLLELARDLIKRARDDPAHPIPVVFNLSSWALRRSPLEAWLVDELSQRYDVPRKLGEHWVEHDRVLPLLDGLDEVSLNHREECVEKINAFREEHGLLPLVVCSRSAEYDTLSKQLRLLGAVTIQPLTREKIEHYLARAGKSLSGAVAAVQDDPTLWELLDTPLMLSILALAYQGRIASEIKIAQLKGNVEERRAALFDAYIEAMLKPTLGRHRVTTLRYTTKQTRRWLYWLAHAMIRFEQTVFYLERMQPDWLLQAHQLPQRKASALAGGLVGGVIGGVIGGLNAGLDGGLAGMLACALVGGLNAGLAEKIEPVEALHWSLQEAVKGLISGLVLGLIFGLFLGLVFGLVGWLIFGLVGWLVFGLIVGLIVGLISGLRGGIKTADIHVRVNPNEGIRRSLRNALVFGLVFGLVGWLLGGLASGLVDGLVDGLVSGLVFGLVGGLVLWLLFRLGLWLVGRMVNCCTALFWLFTLYNLVGGLLYVLLLALVVGLVLWLDVGLSVGLVFGLVFGFDVWLEKGGRACIQHSSLRVLLWWYDYAPLNYLRFLDHANDLLFLRRVGGGYIFVHRLLMEHFAGLEGQRP